MKVRELIAQLQDDIDPEGNIYVEHAVEVLGDFVTAGEWMIDALETGRDEGGPYVVLRIR